MRIALGLAGLVLAMALPCPAGEAKTVRLTVKVEQLPSTEGQLMLQFYALEGFLKTPVKKVLVKLTDKDLSQPLLVPVDIAPGTYAIGACHDRNQNAKVDRNFVGVPKERFGFSNKVHPKWSPPKWDKVKFEVPRDAPVEIVIRKW